MTTIGQSLTTPEVGWRRIDHKGPFQYVGAKWVDAGSMHYVQNSDINQKIKFRFTGAKLRIVATVNNTGITNGKISIDGVEYSFTENYATETANALVFEQTVTNGEHDVSVWTTDTSNYFRFTAVDIDETGRILHPDEVTDINDLAVGKRIRASYQAASGVAGSINSLGTSNDSFIPSASSATPNGAFYFMMVGEDHLGRKKLISDRNIQQSISWDTLNTAGIASGSGLPLLVRNDDVKIKLGNPSSLPLSTGNGVAFSPDGNYMSVAHATSPFITIYKREGDTFTKLADPSTLPTNSAQKVNFSPDGNYMSVAHATSPFITIYKREGDTFTKLADPSTPLPSTALSVDFSPDGNYMSVAHASSPYITIYKREGDTFTKLPNPDTLIPSTGNGVAFSPDGIYMSVGHTTTPFITIYKREGDTFTKLPNPSTLPTGTGGGVAFSPDSNYMSIVHSTSPYMTIYKREGDTFTKLADPSTLLPSQGVSVDFSPNGIYMSVGHASSPYITVYKRERDTFTKLPNPFSLPTGTGNGVNFSPDGNYMSVAHPTTPFITIYKNAILYDGEDYEFTARLMTGGTSSTDKDNEWDQIIAGSSLGGAITPGDNNVWNWSGISSWTSSIGTTAANRIHRGNSTLTSYATGQASSYSATGTGYRPVLLINPIPIPNIQKMFVLDGGNYKKWNTTTSSWEVVSATLPSEDVFKEQGMSINEILSEDRLALLSDNFKIIVYNNKVEAPKVNASRSYPKIGTRIIKN